MKYCVPLRWVFSVLCLLLLNVRTGWMRPAVSSEAGYPPPLNCSTPADWAAASGSRPRRPPEDFMVADSSAEMQDLDVAGPSEPATTTSPSLAHSYINSSPHSLHDFYYSQRDLEYFDYYYEEYFTETGERDSVDNEQTVHYQPPPGLNRVAKLKLMKTPRRQPPEYMLELYDRFSRMRPTLATRSPRKEAPEDPDLGADIVRSFPNINKEDSAEASPEENEVTPSEDPQLAGGNTRHHTLVFNITSLLTGEKVSRAELRLYTLVEQDRNTYMGEDRVVRVFEGLKNYHLPPVASRHVYGHSGGWEAFDVTSVVQSWVLKGSRTGDGVHVLDVKIDSLFQSEVNGSGTSMDIDVDPEHNEGPLLVVFSKDATWHLQQQELHEVIHHEQVHDQDKNVSVESSSHYPTSSEKTDTGSAITSERTPPPQTVAGDGDLSLPVTAVSWKSDEEKEPLRRVRRDKRKRNSCRRKTMYVDFQDINWHQWIIAPPGYMAFECVGKCYVPIGAHLSPTKHAIIQTLVHAAHPKRAQRACCVPTKLEPISILYLDENNIITYKYQYDDMVVAECGCR